MNTRRLGTTELEVAPICLGGNVFGWTADEKTSFAVLDAFVDGGFNFIDTADVYSHWVPGHPGGESETIIGKWFQRSGKRRKVILATKVGSEMTPDRKGLSKAYILKEVETSLTRLQTDTIDLYQSHCDDPNTPQEETSEAFATLLKQGKVRAIGASNISGQRLSQAIETARGAGHPSYQSLQPHYNLCERAKFETELLPVCERYNLAVIPYYALASGFLTGKYRSKDDLAKSQRGRAVEKYLNERGFRILAALDEVAGRLSSTPARVALAWLLTRPCVTAPIASATSVQQVEELMAAADLNLDPATVDALTSASE